MDKKVLSSIRTLIVLIQKKKQISSEYATDLIIVMLKNLIADVENER